MIHLLQNLFIEKGLINFPKDFWLNLNMGYNSFFELKKKNEGVYYYKKALKNSKFELYNSNLPFFLTNYLSSINAKKAAMEILEYSLRKSKDPKLKELF